MSWPNNLTRRYQMDLDGNIHFETPENIRVEYHLAGLGSRFVAWCFDILMILLGMLSILIILSVIGAIVGGAGSIFEPFVEASGAVVSALLMVGNGFIFFLYFALYEWFRRGQTPGKRLLGIRTVMTGGFSLSFSSIAIRNLFRLLDTFPVFWFVPLVTGQSQRFGDIVAGTVVVAEGKGERDSFHDQLLMREPSAIQYQFSSDQLSKLTEKDHKAVSAFLRRAHALDPDQAEDLADKLATGISKRMNLTLNLSYNERVQFLEDLIATEFKNNS